MENIASLWDLTKGPCLRNPNPDELKIQDLGPLIDSDIATVDMQKIPEILQDYLPKDLVLANYQKLFKMQYKELVEHIATDKMTFKCDMTSHVNQIRFRFYVDSGINFIKNLTLKIETMDHKKIPDGVETSVTFGSCINHKEMCTTGITKDGQVSINLDALILVDLATSTKLYHLGLEFIHDLQFKGVDIKLDGDLADALKSAFIKDLYLDTKTANTYIDITLKLSTEDRYVADIDVTHSTIDYETIDMLKKAPILATTVLCQTLPINLENNEHSQETMPVLTQENLELINNLK